MLHFLDKFRDKSVFQYRGRNIVEICKLRTVSIIAKLIYFSANVSLVIASFLSSNVDLSIGECDGKPGGPTRKCCSKIFNEPPRR